MLQLRALAQTQGRLFKACGLTLNEMYAVKTGLVLIGFGQLGPVDYYMYDTFIHMQGPWSYFESGGAENTFFSSTP